MARQNYATGIEQDPRRAEASVRLCRRAVEIDPGYALAWALMALGQMLLHFAHGKRGDDGMAAAERALALDADLAEAHAVKARILSQYGRHDEASAEIDVALRSIPSPTRSTSPPPTCACGSTSSTTRSAIYEKAMALMETDVNSPSMLLTCYAAVGDRRRRRARGAHRAGPRRKDPGAGPEQRRRHGLRRDALSSASADAERAQGVDQSRAADRSGQHEHALQLRLRADDSWGRSSRRSTSSARSSRPRTSTA